MIFNTTINNILDKITNVLGCVDEKKIKTMIQRIDKAERIFILGSGRSGLIGHSFAMRLVHLGYTVHIVNYTTTPAINKDDLLISISGSGSLKGVTKLTETASQIGADTLAITSNEDSYLARIANKIVIIPSHDRIIDSKGLNYDINKLQGKSCNNTPMGTLFELSCIILLDGVISILMNLNNKSEKDLKKMHSNLE